MRVPQRLSAVLLFAVVGLLALLFSGLLDWITSLLFLVLESLAGCFRPWVGRSQSARFRAPVRSRSSVVRRERPRRLARHRKAPRWLAVEESRAGATDPNAPAAPRLRILVPLSAERPGLIDFALHECQGRRAELLVLFLRPLAVMPMGPNALPTLAEDAPARTVLERVAEQAREAGVPHRTLYEVSRDMPAAILEAARTHEADVLVMEATRRGLLWRALVGDQVQSVLMHLPERVSLLIHA